MSKRAEHFQAAIEAYNKGLREALLHNEMVDRQGGVKVEVSLQNMSNIIAHQQTAMGELIEAMRPAMEVPWV